MKNPLLTIAANSHYWLTFEACNTAQWDRATEWLKQAGFSKIGTPVWGMDEAIFPSFVKQDVTVEAGADHWSGNYLLAVCDNGDQVILNLAKYVSAEDRRASAC